MKKNILIISGLLGATAVALGALGAHFLKSKLSTGLITETNLQTFDTAAKYQMYHAIMLFVIAFFVDSIKPLKAAAYCFITGILFFSGSLYLLATAGLLGLENVRWAGPITPIGGLFFIAGWILISIAGFKLKNNTNAL